MDQVISHIREEIKSNSNRSDEIRELSNSLLVLACKIFDDPEYNKTSSKLFKCVEKYCQDYDDLLDLATIINDEDQPDYSDYLEKLKTLDVNNKLESIDNFIFSVDDIKSMLLLNILLLAINKQTDKDYSEDIVHERVYDNLRSDCKSHTDIWRCSIYGSGWDDGENPRDKYTEPYDPFSIEKRKITKTLTCMNYCGTSPRLSEYFCNSCKENFIKIGYHLQQNTLHLLADDWNSPYDIIKLDTIKRPQSETQFLQEHPECAKLVEKSYERENTDLICKLDDYFDGDLNCMLDDICQKEILNIGWYFDGNLSPLMSCTNLKGLVLGHWFSKSLNVLENHPSLKFIRVQPSYNQRITESVYNITFC